MEEVDTTQGVLGRNEEGQIGMGDNEEEIKFERKGRVQ